MATESVKEQMFVTSGHSARERDPGPGLLCVGLSFSGLCFDHLGDASDQPGEAGPSLMSDEHQHQPSTMEQEWSPNMGMGLYGTIWNYMGLYGTMGL